MVILVAIVVNEDGYREVLVAAEGMKEDKATSALHRLFLPQCVICDTALECKTGGKDAQGDLCSGKQECI